MRLTMMISSLIFVLSACGTEGEQDIACACEGEIVQTFTNSEAYIKYDDSNDRPVLMVREEDNNDGSRRYRRYLACNLTSDQEQELSVDSLILIVSGQQKRHCPWVRVAYSLADITDYMISSDNP